MPKAKTKKPKVQNSTQRPLRIVLTVFALCLWVLIALYGAQYLTALLFTLAIDYDTLLTPLWSSLYTAATYALTLVLTIFVPVKVFKRWPTTREELGLKELPTWTDLALAPVGLVATLVLGVALVSLFGYLFPGLDMTEAQDLAGFENLVSKFDRTLAFFALVVVAPVAEELIFRGWLYGKLRATISGKLSLVLSILLVSVLFGLVHGQWNVGLTVFAMSVVSCVFREITGTAYAGILLHMLKNGVAFVLLFVFNIV